MDSKFTILANALNQLSRGGMCSIGESHTEVIALIMQNITACGNDYSIRKVGVTVQIFMTVNNSSASNRTRVDNYNSGRSYSNNSLSHQISSIERGNYTDR